MDPRPLVLRHHFSFPSSSFTFAALTRNPHTIDAEEYVLHRPRNVNSRLYYRLSSCKLGISIRTSRDRTIAILRLFWSRGQLMACAR